ncbi:DCN1-like protein 1 [Irineochytrium annulatum]|nr:DCN1-like protein 1 [Irineochytrium annulatum]
MQREKVKQFQAFTGVTDDKTASAFLKKHSWDLEVACDAYFNSGATSHAPAAPAVDARQIGALFDKFKDPEEDYIGIEGTEALCQALEVDPSDVVTLVLAWHLGCKQMCDFRRPEWIDGWTKLGCDSLAKMKNAIPTLRAELNDPVKFKDIYQYTFNFARQESQRSLLLDTAVAFWQLLLEGRFKHLDLWVEYVTEHYKKSISKDTWNQVISFT